MDTNIPNRSPNADDIDGVLSPFCNKYFVGHKENIDYIEKSFKANKMHQAFLLSGEKGIGKQSFSLRMAYHLLSKSDDFHLSPDLNSTLWQQITNNISQNFLYISRPYDQTAKKFKNTISIDTIRTLPKILSHISIDKYYVIIIDSIDYLNNNSLNALLKILEEPPQNTVFFLISHLIKPVLATIKSRAIKLNFYALPNNEVYNAVRNCLIDQNIDRGKLKSAVDKSEGNVRRAAILYSTNAKDIEAQLNNYFNNKILKYDLLQNLISKTQNNDLIYEQFIYLLLDILNKNAKHYIQEKDPSKSNKLANFWFELQNRMLTNEILNINKHQELANIMVELYNLFHEKSNFSK